MAININQTIDKMVKNKFLTIYSEASKKAHLEFDETISPTISHLSSFEKIQFLQKEKGKISQLQSEIKVAAYVGIYSQEIWLMKMFASRTTLLNVDESDDLYKAVFLGTLLSFLNDEFVNIAQEIPPFSFVDFLNGKDDKYFFELDYTYHFKDRDDLLQIRKWQADKIVSMISSEVPMAIKKIQTNYLSDAQAMLILSKDLTYYKNLKKGKFESPEQLITELSKISFLPDYDFNLLNNAGALEDFKTFQQEELSWNKITPALVKDSRSLYLKAGSKHLFSKPPIIFYTLYQVIQWIALIEKGQKLMHPFVYPAFDKIVSDVLKNAEIEADEFIDVFGGKNNIHKLPKEKAIALYIEELEKIRSGFNSMEEFEKQYFASIHREETTEIFTLNSIFFDLTYHSEGLKNAASIYHRFVIFFAAYRHLSGSTRIQYPNLDHSFNHTEVNYLASTMVLDNDLYDKLQKVTTSALTDMLEYCLPMDFMIQNHSEQMHEIFVECVDRLLSYLEDAEPGNKVLYIHSRLKELKQRELSHKIEFKNSNTSSNLNYTSLLKEYLELEAEYIKETKDIQFFTSFPLTTNKSVLKIDSQFSFGYKLNDTTKLMSFIIELNNKIDLLNEIKTTPADFVNVLSAKSISKDLPSVYFSCETTQLFYIFSKLKVYFSNLTFTNIENSQLFYTKNNTLLKAQNLSASKVQYPKNYEEIDKAFFLLH